MNTIETTAKIIENLRSLNGSEKQIAWAESLRNDKIKELVMRLHHDQGVDCEKILALFIPQGNVPMTGAMALVGKIEAKWWIDNRKLTTKQLIIAAQR